MDYGAVLANLSASCGLVNIVLPFFCYEHLCRYLLIFYKAIVERHGLAVLFYIVRVSG